MNVERRSDIDTLQNRKYIILSAEYKERDSYYPLDITGYQSLLRYKEPTLRSGAQFVSINPDNETLTIRDEADTETISFPQLPQDYKPNMEQPTLQY